MTKTQKKEFIDHCKRINIRLRGLHRAVHNFQIWLSHESQKNVSGRKKKGTDVDCIRVWAHMGRDKITKMTRPYLKK